MAHRVSSLRRTSLVAIRAKRTCRRALAARQLTKMTRSRYRPPKFVVMHNRRCLECDSLARSFGWRASPKEAAPVHRAARRRGCGVAARGARAAVGSDAAYRRADAPSQERPQGQLRATAFRQVIEKLGFRRPQYADRISWGLGDPVGGLNTERLHVHHLAYRFSHCANRRWLGFRSDSGYAQSYLQ